MLANWLRTLVCGLCVGAADIVPGISGGTVAFIIGIYEELLDAISNVRRHLFFLSAFLLGVCISFVTLAKGFQQLINSELFRPLLYSLFMGLVAGSVIFCSRLLASFNLKSFIFLSLGAVSAYFLSGADLVPKGNEPCYNVAITVFPVPKVPLANYDPAGLLLGVPESQLAVMLAKKYIDKNQTVINVETGKKSSVDAIIGQRHTSVIDLWIVACGAMAISAMLLPGISGSYLLNILGMYGFILGALVDWVEGLKAGFFDFGSFRTVFSMGLGIALGALVFARAVRYLLTHYREIAIATLVGFMIGALRAVWPFWSLTPKLSPLHLTGGPILHPEYPILPDLLSSQFAISCLFFAVGLGLVLLVEHLAQKKRGQYTNL